MTCLGLPALRVDWLAGWLVDWLTTSSDLSVLAGWLDGWLQMICSAFALGGDAMRCAVLRGASELWLNWRGLDWGCWVGFRDAYCRVRCGDGCCFGEYGTSSEMREIGRGDNTHCNYLSSKVQLAGFWV
ncbi:uncharacterized protein BO95DRAFT_80903 [Aspergillus brunneoviolaceus CBS 621.78]|uniref:Uncharacterized protein n=1 Tax=Aspergillus brunneoviolaceus CBS 621.78 TaxID=1450534 RepID=A0ACD1GE78_9EURO|nr:hypothetical protein BO95DRAFT_80903 [Aspergillus brunneoviolaceus CBS 621.78]RAH47594.1 hypothetical protein BO95DRAFT_80903 [Aspergillus brunneoviolaceus CBS 621.78]